MIEKNKRFSESILWDLQQAAYSEYGIKAWTAKGVPFYLTSNPFTARKYAKVILGYIRDCKINPKHPLILFDLGAGTGRFGYLFLKFLIPEISELLGRIKIRYIMTDIVKDNLEFLQNHPYLKGFIDEGILDFAFYHHAQKEPIALLLSKEKLTPEKLHNPIILIANYFFDTIPQDLFRIKKGKLEEGRVTIQGIKKELDPALIENLRCSYDYLPIKHVDQYYPDHPELNRLLYEYVQRFDNITFLFPIGAFQSLKYFSLLSQGRMLLLAGDQGVCTEEQIRAWGEPHIARHGTFSIAVNYEILARYFDNEGGLGLLTKDSDPLFVVIAGILGGRKYPETSMAFLEELDSFEPKDYWHLAEGVEKECKEPSLEHLLTLLKFGYWDPMNFYAFYPLIRKQASKASEAMQDKILNAIHWTLEQFYPIGPEDADFVMNLGALAFEMKRYQEAVVLFEKSLSLGGDRSKNLMNMATCYKALNDTQNALKCLHLASDSRPETRSPMPN